LRLEPELPELLELWQRLALAPEQVPLLELELELELAQQLEPERLEQLHHRSRQQR
jgi:hypothetical protein